MLGEESSSQGVFINNVQDSPGGWGLGVKPGENLTESLIPLFLCLCTDGEARTAACGNIRFIYRQAAFAQFLKASSVSALTPLGTLHNATAR